MSWACSSCTFLNPPSQKSTCQICLNPPTHQWSCEACTFLNSYKHSYCQLCHTRNFSSLSNFDVDDGDVDLGLGGCSSGSVFYPLKGSDSGPKFEPLEVLDVGSGGESVEVGSDKKSSDDVGNARAGKGPVSVEISGNVDGSDNSKRKIQDLGNFFEKAFESDGFRLVKCSKMDLSSGNVAAAFCSTSAETSQKNEDKKKSGEVKILSYNVWFREEIELRRRMQAISDLILKHSPDVICFQEVTPNIYTIFSKSVWWKQYRCSVSYEKAASGVYFCMQLAKLPVKSFTCRPFGYTAMSRELCIAEIETRLEKSLVIATSHLESPSPGPPKFDQFYSKERVNQAKEAIDFLHKYPNVIFCGDMNWDDKRDGKFPSCEGWFDAWEKLRPGEVGYTYDTKSNKMISGYKSLQKRLDRFMCCLTDFDVTRIDMIGTEALPGLTHIHTKKTKNKIYELTLPVLPSDHYGLLLTITRK